jgi:DNA polymerase
VAEYKAYAAEHGHHHPDRQLGKIGELAGGFGGGWGAWVRFGADKYMTEDEGRARVKEWRGASPMIPRLWYALDDAAIAATRNPGTVQPVVQKDWQGRELRTVPGLTYLRVGGVLWCNLPSGGRLAYHNPEVRAGVTPWGSPTDVLVYDNYNTDSKRGRIGWQRLESWYGLLVENIVQAIARDIQAAALLRLAAAGYDIVLHVHDEIVAEVRRLFGSVEHFEAIMRTREPWFRDWPINVSGGYREPRYKKG